MTSLFLIGTACDMRTIRMPDGTLIRNVPDDATKEEVMAKYKRRLAVKEMLEKEEGHPTKSYRDSLGNLTGGAGHLLTAAEAKKYPEGTEIPKQVRDQWFNKDTSKAFRAARKQAKELGLEDDDDFLARLTAVNFQVGVNWNKEFKNTWGKLKSGDWQGAATNLGKSKWAKQTPKRVQSFQKAIRSLEPREEPQQAQEVKKETKDDLVKLDDGTYEDAEGQLFAVQNGQVGPLETAGMNKLDDGTYQDDAGELFTVKSGEVKPYVA